MNEKDPYENIETLRAFIKEQILEFMDKKSTEPAKFSTLFKDFPDFEKLNFGIKMGSIITGIMSIGKQKGVRDDMVGGALREALEDLHDILLLKYQKIG